MTRRIAAAIVFSLVAAQVSAQVSTQSGLSADNVSKYIGNDRWEWTVFVRAVPSTIREIQSVEYQLHPTFTPSVVTVTETSNPQMPFGLTRTGWGVFEIRIKVMFRDGRTTRLTHMLTFEPPDTLPCLPEVTVEQERYQLLRDPRFNSEVYVYVGDIKKMVSGPSRSGFRATGARLVLFVGSHDAWGDAKALKEPDFDAQIRKTSIKKWELSFVKSGASLQFDYNGKPYVLSVTKLQTSLGGDKVSLQVCEK